MLKEFLGRNKEIFIYCSNEMIIKVLNEKDHSIEPEDNVLLIYPIEGEYYLNTVGSNDTALIKESVFSDTFIDNLFIRLRLNREDETKVSTLLTLGLDFKDIIYLNFIKDKEDELQWEKYRDFESN